MTPPPPARAPRIRPASSAPGPVSRRQLQAPPASCTSLAKRPAPRLATSVCAPRFGASAPCLLALPPQGPRWRWKPSQSPASFGDGHPSTHGVGSRSRTGKGQGPTSAWLRPAPPHEQFAAPQHRRAGRTKRGQRSSRSTQFHAVPPHQQLAAQQYRFSAQRSTAFRHTAVPQFRSTSSSQQTFLTTIEYSPSRHIGRSLRRAPGSFRTPGPAGRTPCIASARGSAVSIASRPWQLPGTLLRLSHAHQENPQL